MEVEINKEIQEMLFYKGCFITSKEYHTNTKPMRNTTPTQSETGRFSEPKENFNHVE
jgi:hypothetical protein